MHHPGKASLVFYLVIMCALGILSTVSAEYPDSRLVEISGAEAMLDRGLSADHPPILAVHPSAKTQTVEHQPMGYGIQDACFMTVMGTAFNPTSSDAEYYSATNGGLTCNSGSTYEYFDAQLEPPVGARIEGIRFWTYDSDGPENMHAFLWETCQPFAGPGTPIHTELFATDISSGTGGEWSQFVDVPDRTANTAGCVYRVRVRFGLNNNCNGESLRLHKARLQFRRQVSPAPVTATFNDVGTGHLFFRYVEALVDSGITAGCGGGSYCPDAPVTRGQMAVFLSKALGLHWSWRNF